jgi:hypothetical protein
MGMSLKQVERLALRNAFDYVDQHHIGQFLGHDPVRGRGAYVACAHNAYFLTHLFSPWGRWSVPQGLKPRCLLTFLRHG